MVSTYTQKQKNQANVERKKPLPGRRLRLKAEVSFIAPIVAYCAATALLMLYNVEFR
jgi:hypothetical protein